MNIRHEASRDRPTNLFHAAILFTVLLLGIDLAVTSLVTNQQQRTIFSDVFAPVVEFLASAALFIAAKKSASHSKRLAIAWGMIGLATFAFALGDTVWGILEVGLKEPPFPSIADGFYLAYYPFLLVGVLFLLDKPASIEESINQTLDIGIVMVAAILMFWNFLLGPIVLSNADYPLLEQVILLAYPVGDLVVFGALLLIINRPSEKQAELPVFLLAGGFTAMIVSDCIYSYQSLVGTYVSGSLLDMGWILSTLLMGMAGVSQLTAVQSFNETGIFLPKHKFLDRLNAIKSYIPYLWLVGAYILLIMGGLTPLPMNFLSLSLGVGGIICLVLLRQIITLFENKKLNTRLQQTMGRLQAQATELDNTNQELQLRIMERRKIEEQLSYDALHDAMTGLANRVLFLDRLGQAIEYGKRRAEYLFAVLFIDIDQFKVINDSLGHLTGDKLLISVSRRMHDCLRSSDTVSRFGGDEFAILLEITGDSNSAPFVAMKIQEVIQSAFELDGHKLYVTASIGIVMNMVGYDHPEEVLRDADIAMYEAKTSGKAHFEIFDIRMRTQAFSRMEMEHGLRAGLENREFQLYYQPILSLESNRVVSFEALIRWFHPKRGLLLPGEFLSTAEESGLILPIGEWVLNEACLQLKTWHEKYPRLENANVNVNISNRQFSQPNFVDNVVKALHTSGLKAESLRLEITENVLISNYETANKIFSQLQDLGIQLQIDDFGSGYSALGYLQHFPINAIKIDKSFIDEIGKGHRGNKLVRAIVAMARELGMETIAEGIETGEQLNELRSLACSFGQGFLLSKPLNKESAEEILAKQENT